jgi:signal peptide peptidase SppA
MPEAHKRISDVVHDHYTGVAHDHGGRADIDIDPADLETEGREDPPGIKVIDIYGPLAKRVSDLQLMSGVTDIDVISNQIDEALADDTVEGIFLDVDSPGGSVTGIPELAEKIRLAKAQKPIVAFTDSLMASAAYWIAAGASAIVSTGSAMVGSIGVYMAWLDVSRKFEMEGMRTELIKAGKFKATGITGIALTDEQRALLQAEIDEVFGWFAKSVRLGRGQVASDTMEGQTFYGQKSVELNLVDRVGDADAALTELRAMATQKNKGTA